MAKETKWSIHDGDSRVNGYEAFMRVAADGFLQVLLAVKFSAIDSARRLCPSVRNTLSPGKRMYHLNTDDMV